MWTERIALVALLAAPAAPAAADYAHAPFHDRPVEIAERGLAVLAGGEVAVPQDDVPLAAAVAAFLLLSEVGLAEAFEEAVEDGDAASYDTAHQMLQRLRPWVAAVPTDAGIDELMGRLDALMPTPERPEALDADPEAAEVVAQALVGRLETVADADLYLGRDLGRAIGTVARIAAQGCGATGDRAHSYFEIAALYFEDALEAPLSVMAPGPAEAIEEGFEALAAGEDACGALGEAFVAARQTLFPEASP